MFDQKTFTFPFEDEDWINKFLIGSLLHLIAPFLLYIPIIVPRGYSLRVWRDAIAGLPPRLTEWDDWEEVSLQGLVYYAVMLLYSLPALLLWAVVAAVAVGGGGALAWVIEALEGGGASAIGQGLASLLMIVGVGSATVLALVVSVLVAFVYPIAVGRYLEKGYFGAAFELGALWRAVRANLGGLVVAWIITLVINLVFGTIVSMLSIALCFIPFVGYLLMAPVSFYVSLVWARLMGQVYHKAQRRLGLTPDVVGEVQLAEPVTVAPEPRETVEEPAVRLPEEVSRAGETSIESLELSTRVLRVLQGVGITTVGQVLERLGQGDAALLAIRGLGTKALDEVKAQLVDKGFLDSP